MSGPGTLTITDRGGGNPFILEHSDAHPSWVLNGPGDFSCILPDRVAVRFGLGGINALGSKWVRYETADLPPWGGIVTPIRFTEGMMQLNATEFHSLFRKRRVNRIYGQQRATAGALAQRAYNDVQSDDPTFIASFQADEDGDPVDYEWRGGDLMDDVFVEVAGASGQEWTVDADRNAYWRVRLGTDISGSTQLTYPHEIVSIEYDGDLWACINDLEGVAADDRYADAAYFQADDDDSVKLRGRLMASIRYSGVVSKGTVRPKVLRDLRKFRNPTQMIQLKTMNIAHSWSRYVLGDSVLVLLPGPNVLRVVRIKSRSVDIDSGIETLGVVVE